MGNGKEKGIKSIAINIIRGLLIIAFLTALYTNRPLVLLFSVLGFSMTFLPMIFKEFFGVGLPAFYEIIIIAFIYGILFLGDVRGFFPWDWWDILLNFVAALALGVIGFTVLFTLYKDKKIRANPFILAILTFSFTVAIGSVWEVAEFMIDHFLKMNLQNDLGETMKDLTANMAGALVVSFFGYQYLKEGKLKIISEFITKQIERNPRIFGKRDTLEESSQEIMNLVSRGEGSRLEFKSTLRMNLYTMEIDNRIEHTNLKTLAAFMNSQGGTLLIGVSDDGKVQGLEKDRFKDNDALNLHFTNLLKNYLGSEFLPFIRFELHPIKDLHILKIDCIQSKKPVFVKFRDEEEFFIRNGPSSVKLTGRELVD